MELDRLDEARAPAFGKDWDAHKAYKNYDHHASHADRHANKADLFNRRADDHAGKAEHHLWHSMNGNPGQRESNLAKVVHHVQEFHRNTDLEHQHDKWYELHSKMADKLEGRMVDGHNPAYNKAFGVKNKGK